MYLTRPDGNRSAMRLTQTAGTVQNGEWKTSWQIPGNIGSTQQTYGIQVAVYDVAGNMVTSQTLPVLGAGQGAGADAETRETEPAVYARLPTD